MKDLLMGAVHSERRGRATGQSSDSPFRAAR
jgi:hypothetical protein